MIYQGRWELDVLRYGVLRGSCGWEVLPWEGASVCCFVLYLRQGSPQTHRLPPALRRASAGPWDRWWRRRRSSSGLARLRTWLRLWVVGCGEVRSAVRAEKEIGLARVCNLARRTAVVERWDGCVGRRLELGWCCGRLDELAAAELSGPPRPPKGTHLAVTSDRDADHGRR